MRFLKATTIFNGREKLPGDPILVLDNEQRLEAIVNEREVDKGNLETFDGILTPGFVNAHCHLELSHMKDTVPQHTGLPGFARHIITQRNNFSQEEIAEKMTTADEAMYRNGIVAVGDISNGPDSFACKTRSKIHYHTFIELLGLNPSGSELIFDKGLELLKRLQDQGLKGSLAPHAPYSTSTQLIEKISGFDSQNNLPLSIHNQESEEESKFFKGEANGFHDLFSFLGLDLSWFEAPGTSSFQAYAPFLAEHMPSMMVHNTFTSKEDLELAASKNAFWCFCPAANLYIENRLPDFSLFKNRKNRICLGTDSLASNTQLDLINEINLILKHSNCFTPENLLQAATSNAAAALGISDQFGSLILGKNTGLNLLEFNDSQFHFVKKIV